MPGMPASKLSLLGRIVAFATLSVSLAGCGQSGKPEAQPEAVRGPGVFVPDTKPVPVARWLDGTVPRGTPIKLSMIDTLSPQTSHKGDAFRALVTDAVMVDGMVVVPSGSNILGVVSEVSPAALRLQFDRIDTPTGASAPLKARLKQAAPGPVLRSNTPITVVLEEPLQIKVKQ